MKAEMDYWWEQGDQQEGCKKMGREGRRKGITKAMCANAIRKPIICELILKRETNKCFP